MNKKKESEQKSVTPRDLDKKRWIRTPVAYAQQVATLNRMQSDVMLLVSQNMQDYIQKFFEEGRNKLEQDPNPAIPEDVINKGIPMIRLMMNDVVDKYHYGRLAEALKDMRDLSVRTSSLEQLTNKKGEPMVDKKGNPVKRTVYRMTPIFSTIAIPDLGKNFQYIDKETGKLMDSSNFRLGYIDMKINPEVVRTLFNMNHGFIEHIARIAKYSKTDVTAKIYLFIKTKIFVFHSNKFKVPYKELKRATGHIISVFNKDTQEETIVEKYSRWTDYKIRVLEPAVKDMNSLALNNNTEFVFRYLPIYNGLKKVGNPDEVEFLVYPSELGKERKLSKGKTPQAVEQNLFASNPESRQEMGRMDWEHLLKSYRGSLKDIMKRAKLVSVGKDKIGGYFQIQFETKEDYDYVQSHANGFNEFMKVCYKTFGATYKSVYGFYEKK